MQPTTKILIGSPLRGEEAQFLRSLVRDLAVHDLLILANFIADDRQIDFVIVTPTFAALLEHKNFTRPIFGEKNGNWMSKDSTGALIPTSNSYQQALSQNYALSDEMRAFCKATPQVPASTTGNFYTNYRTFVCIYPHLPAGSNVTTGDHRVSVGSYATVLEKLRAGTLKSSWGLADWERFGLQRLHLTAASLTAATNEKELAHQDQLIAYQTRLTRFLTKDLPPLLPTTVDERYGSTIIGQLRGPLNYLLCGPSGATKTFHLRHFAVDSLSSGGELPLFVDAKRYAGGDFWTYLRHAIAPFFRGDPSTLLTAGRNAGLRPVLIIDALNECALTRRDEFLKGVQAFTLHYDARVVVSDHQQAPMVGGLTVDPIRLKLPTVHQRRAIYAYHAALPPSADLDNFCAGFSNAYDLELAGRCHRDGPPPRSRAELYDRYVNTALGAAAPVLSTALLRHLADKLGDDLTMVMSREGCEIAAQTFLDEQDAPLTILDAIFESRLVQVTGDSFAFEHQLLLAYFQAESLRRKAISAAVLGAELAKPRNADLFDFILPRVQDKTDAGVVLKAATSLSTLIAVSQGQFGAPAQAALLQDCERYLGAALADLKTLRASIQTIDIEDGKRRIAHVYVRSGPWSSWDGLLGQLLPYVSSKVIQGRTLELVDASERALRALVQFTAEKDGIKPERAWAHFVDDLARYGRSPGVVPPPYELLLHAWRDFSSDRLAPIHESDVSIQSFRARLMARASQDPPQFLALLPLLEGYGSDDSAEQITESLSLIERALRLDIGTIRLQALHRLHNMCHVITTRAPAAISRVRSILEGADFTGTLLESLKFEIMSHYHIIDPPVSLAEAKAEVQALLAPTPESEALIQLLCETSGETESEVRTGLAYRYISMMFEDVFQGVYYEVYEGLSASEKLALLLLGAQVKDSHFYLSWILEEIVALDAPEVLPIFQRAAQVVNLDSPMPQEEVAAFRTAIEGCARWSQVGPEYIGNGSVFDAAWRTLSHELFWGHRRREGKPVAARDSGLWEKLRGMERLAAGVALQNLQRSWSFAEQRVQSVDLVAQCEDEIRELASYCLSNRRFLKDLGRFIFEEDLVVSWIDILERIGLPEQLSLLETFVENATYGKSALAAIKAIKSREQRAGVA
jgi:hypothetical protein